MGFPNVKARMAFFAKQKDKSGLAPIQQMKSDRSPHAISNGLSMPKPPAGPRPLPNEPKNPMLPKMAKFPKVRKFFKS
jgi:hypothetical protein